MLTRQAGQVDTIWDELFPEFVRTLPDDLARLDQVLDAPAVLRQFEWWAAVDSNHLPPRYSALSGVAGTRESRQKWRCYQA